MLLEGGGGYCFNLVVICSSSSVVSSEGFCVGNLADANFDKFWLQNRSRDGMGAKEGKPTGRALVKRA